VIPYLGVIEQLEKEVSNNSPQMWSYFLQGLEKEYWPDFMRSAKKGSRLKEQGLIAVNSNE